MNLRLLIPLLAALLLLSAGFQAEAQRRSRKAKPDVETMERLEILEAEYLRLNNEVNLLRERLDAVLGPAGKERIADIAVGRSPVRGKKDAVLTLVEFGDFQSEYSARAAHVVRRLLEEYPERLRFVFKHYPITSLHPEAHEAALAALAAEKQERAWEMYDLLFKNTRRLEQDLYLVLAQQLNLDMSGFERIRRSLWALERLSHDEKAAVRAGVNGVPAFFLNGRPMKSWRYGFLKDQIDRLLPETAARK